MVASIHRSHSIAEKIAMGDGRLDSEKLIDGIVGNAREAALFDMDAVAKGAGAMINAVMLGALAGLGTPAGAGRGLRGRDPRRRPGGRSQPARLCCGARRDPAGCGGAGATRPARLVPPPWRPSPISKRRRHAFAGAADIVVEGLRRLAAYQDVGYARLYLDRLQAVAEADARAQADGRLLRETARHLAVRMSYEDVIRVAQAKIAPERIARVIAQMGGKPGEPVAIIEFLKPGIEEICQILPPRLATAILRLAERRGWTGRFHWGMEIKTTSISGYLRFLMLAKLRRFRPGSYRYREEQTAIEAWLGLIAAASAKSAALALEIAQCARLIKGYGDTWKRGAANYARIEAQVIRPVLAGRIAVARGIDAVTSARTAALLDPDGESLARCLADIARSPGLDIAAE